MNIPCQETAQIVKNEILTGDIHRLTLVSPQIANSACPGQFVMARTGNGLDPLLRRPFSIHQTVDGQKIQILFKVLGKGTRILASQGSGQTVDLLGPLGHGFQLQKNKPVCLVGGGIGMAPLFFLAKELLKLQWEQEIRVLVGARTKGELLAVSGDLEQTGLPLQFATDDGSRGHHGLVIDLLERLEPGRDWHVFACGPQPMLRAISHLCLRKEWPCQVSLETMMACGIAACLGCAVARPGKKEYLHVCKDGPVFDAREVSWI